MKKVLFIFNFIQTTQAAVDGVKPKFLLSLGDCDVASPSCKHPHLKLEEVDSE